MSIIILRQQLTNVYLTLAVLGFQYVHTAWWAFVVYSVYCRTEYLPNICFPLSTHFEPSKKNEIEFSLLIIAEDNDYL